MFGRDAAGNALVGGAPFEALLKAADVRTPAYVYDLDAMQEAASALGRAFGDAKHLVAYAVKANSAGPVVRTLADAGCGADVVSGAELVLVGKLGVLPDDVVFSGVAKQDDEIDLALSVGERGVLAIQIESMEEIERVAARARAHGRKQARVSLRVNPGIEVDTHAHIATGHDAAKFGIAHDDLRLALGLVERHAELVLTGVSCHVGAQQTQTSAYLRAAELVMRLACDVAKTPVGRALAFVDTGGGFGIDYGQGISVTPADFARGLVGLQPKTGTGALRLVVEPGRALVGSHGYLVASVVQAKRSPSKGLSWLMIDAGMNDLIRPALYQARHRIEPLALATGSSHASFRVVGPICESADDFGLYDLPADPPRHVVIRDAGAYGFTMASHYNGRPLPAEVFVSGGKVVFARKAAARDAWVSDRLAGTGVS